MPNYNYTNPFKGLDFGAMPGAWMLDPASTDNGEGAMGAYGLFTSKAEGPPNLQHWLQGQYSRLLGQYYGSQAENPTKSWVEYLADVDLNKQYGGLPPSARGETPGRYAPRSRTIAY